MSVGKWAAFLALSLALGACSTGVPITTHTQAEFAKIPAFVKYAAYDAGNVLPVVTVGAPYGDPSKTQAVIDRLKPRLDLNIERFEHVPVEDAPSVRLVMVFQPAPRVSIGAHYCARPAPVPAAGPAEPVYRVAMAVCVGDRALSRTHAKVAVTGPDDPWIVDLPRHAQPQVLPIRKHEPNGDNCSAFGCN